MANVTRRKVLTGICGAGTILLAGCSDSGNGPPDPETPTSDLLPDTEKWTLEEEIELSAGMVGGNDGVEGRYTGPDGGGYTIEILRFGQESSASDAVSDVYEDAVSDGYEDWLLAFSYGVFVFAMTGPSGDNARDLLAASPALDSETVENKT